MSTPARTTPATRKPAAKAASRAGAPSRLSPPTAPGKPKSAGQQVKVVRKGGKVAAVYKTTDTPVVTVQMARHVGKTGRVAAAPLQQFTYVNLDTIRKGVPAKRLLTVSRRMNLTKGQVLEALKFPASTIDRKISQNEKLTPEQTERFVGLESLIEQVQAMVEESGNPAGFDAAKWLGEWLEQPLPALGGRKPSEYLDTVTGQQYISSLIARMQSGAYA